jgi:small subunit ribosomal protein S17
MEAKTQSSKKKVEITLTGLVVSAKAEKTVTVNVERIFKHPVYKKIVRKRKKYLAHDEKGETRPGDLVRIQMVRPISKRKTWLVKEVLSKAPEKVDTLLAENGGEK